MSQRRKPTKAQRDRLLAANCDRCCVCKRGDVGLHLHHIDADASNTVDANLAVLCVEDHDHHHRSVAYQPTPMHLELGASEIKKGKISWEAFVAEARKPNPSVVATLACFGTHELVHSAQLVMQWPDERIEYVKSFHLLDGDFDRWTDEIIREVESIGPSIHLVAINEPQSVEHCPGCGVGLGRTLNSAVCAKLTDPGWKTDSVCSIYVNPLQPSLAIVVFLRHEPLFSGELHLCYGRFLRYKCDCYEEAIPVRTRPSVRTQATRVVRKVLRDWEPARTVFGTGDHDAPSLLRELKLPICWENESATHGLH